MDSNKIRIADALGTGLYINTSDMALLQQILNCIQQVAPEMLGLFPEPEPHHLEGHLEDEFERPAELVS